MPVRTCIIGIGNSLMGDDGVGVRVAEELASRDLGADASVVVGHLGGMQLVSHLIENDRVFIVDAIDTGESPGSVFRFLAEDGIPMFRSETSHGISIPNLLLGARLSGSTAEVIVYAIQVGQVSPIADELSREVAAAASDVIEMLVAEVTEGAAPAIVDAAESSPVEDPR
ncbi:MAG: hydrogenase maturation protease [Coriobacteriales bacterium]|nr:hydrogenase maturation protease [Coriobacteriales bacterium]